MENTFLDNDGDEVIINVTEDTLWLECHEPQWNGEEIYNLINVPRSVAAELAEKLFKFAETGQI